MTPIFFKKIANVITKIEYNGWDMILSEDCIKLLKNNEMYKFYDADQLVSFANEALVEFPETFAHYGLA